MAAVGWVKYLLWIKLPSWEANISISQPGTFEDKFPNFPFGGISWSTYESGQISSRVPEPELLREFFGGIPLTKPPTLKVTTTRRFLVIF